LVDPGNWREVPVEMANGTLGTAYQYVSPEAESRHFASLQEASKDKLADTNMQAAISLALEDASRSSPELAAAAIEWAQRAMTVPKGGNADDDWMREQAIISAAMIAMRDGEADLRSQHLEWARNIFAQALQTKEAPGHLLRSGLSFNPIAIAFVGMIHALKDRSGTEDVRALLEVAARNPAAAHGFGAAAITLASIDERLPRAVLRCAFAASIRPRREWELHEKGGEALLERHQHRVQAAVDAELAWIADELPEPDWPAFPTETVRPRRGIRLPGGRGQQDTPAVKRSRSDEYTDYQAAALWLRNAGSLVDVVQRPWIRDITRTYGSWTAAANGAGLEAYEEVDHSPREWNDAYFDLMAHSLPGLELQEIEQLAIALISSLPDEPFFNVVTQFLRSLDF
ncbi:MAG: ATP-binding protein, partial [Candidatus Edwardsbacteria bacterium]|nr:ATP-binding protein [Candidatus Edwardsbacteria bacterium]